MPHYWKDDAIAFFGEFVGTTMFLFLGEGGIKTAISSTTAAQTQTSTSLSNTEIQIISTSMGLSLLINAWIFFRITGGLFNPAVTFALYLIGSLRPFRAGTLVIAQLLGGIAGSALVKALTSGGVSSVILKLEPGMNYGQGLMLEAFLTATLVFAVLMLAAEKHKATYLAPVGIGLTLFVCQMLGTLWTGCGMNPARALGPSVVEYTFPVYHWIYWLGPIIGALIAVGFYLLLKAFDYGTVVLGQDADHEESKEGKLSLPQKLRSRWGTSGQTDRPDVGIGAFVPPPIRRSQTTLADAPTTTAPNNV